MQVLYNIILLVLFFIMSISIDSICIYFHWYLKRDTNITNTNPSTETVIY